MPVWLLRHSGMIPTMVANRTQKQLPSRSGCGNQMNLDRIMQIVYIIGIK